MANHYDVLGVGKEASKEEIKKAYRTLCMKHHPDIVSQSNPDCNETKAHHEEKFKRISEAHATLIDDKLRARYNYEIQNPTFEGIRTTGNNKNNSNNQHWTRNRGTGRGASYGQQHHFLDGIYRPKNVLFGLTLGFLAVGLVKSFIDPKDEKKEFESYHGKKHLVEAWFNPKTQRYELPAPWDRQYQLLSPKHEMVARHLVHQRDKK